LYVVIVFLLLSPGLSLISLTTGLYLPNDKLVHAFAFCRLLYRGKLNQNILIRVVAFSYAMIIFFALRFSIFQQQPTTSDINLAVTFALIPLTALFFSTSRDFVNALITYAAFASVWGLVQQLLMNLGAVNFLQSMLTYPSQVEGGYIYDPWAPFLYRVSGFQLESSQYSFLLCFALALMKLRSECFDKYKAFIIYISIIINGSTAGYGGLLLIFIFLNKHNYKNLLFIIPILTISLAIASSLGLLDDQYNKILLIYYLSQGISDANINYDRVLGLLSVFDVINPLNLIFGLGLEFRGGHDFFSLMVVGMGIVGVSIIAIYFMSFYTAGNVFIFGLFIFYSIANGSLLDPIYCAVFIYLILIYIEKNERKINNNYSHSK
jgi:hypothetical protein